MLGLIPFLDVQFASLANTSASSLRMWSFGYLFFTYSIITYTWVQKVLVNGVVHSNFMAKETSTGYLEFSISPLVVPFWLAHVPRWLEIPDQVRKKIKTCFLANAGYLICKIPWCTGHWPNSICNCIHNVSISKTLGRLWFTQQFNCQTIVTSSQINNFIN